ncbi:hypothetical protein, partial [Mesorhizobium sp.]|uniref:hypothetical protein n=1 Tax=Mesorhizobium sp. TaxID=1871066 RepID=UPI00257A804A
TRKVAGFSAVRAGALGHHSVNVAVKIRAVRRRMIPKIENRFSERIRRQNQGATASFARPRGRAAL